MRSAIVDDLWVCRPYLNSVNLRLRAPIPKRLDVIGVRCEPVVMPKRILLSIIRIKCTQDAYDSLLRLDLVVYILNWYTYRIWINVLVPKLVAFFMFHVKAQTVFDHPVHSCANSRIFKVVEASLFDMSYSIAQRMVGRHHGLQRKRKMLGVRGNVAVWGKWFIAQGTRLSV